MWIAPEYAKRAFQLSEVTRTNGIRELNRAGLVEVSRRKLVASDSFDFRRHRNVYRLTLNKLAEPAVVPVPAKKDQALEEHRNGK